MMKDKDILNLLKEEDLPESFAIVAEFLGIDTAREMILHLDGLEFRVPRLRTLKSLNLRYLAKRKDEEPQLHPKYLAHELGLDAKTVRQYLKEIEGKYSNSLS